MQLSSEAVKLIEQAKALLKEADAVRAAHDAAYAGASADWTNILDRPGATIEQARAARDKFLLVMSDFSVWQQARNAACDAKHKAVCFVLREVGLEEP